MRAPKVILLLVASFSIASCMGKSGETSHDESLESSANPVVVYYFHSEHRCPTCIAVENETRATLEINLKNETESGKVELQIINVDEAKNKGICEKYGVYGSTLLLVKGNSTINLTNMAFANARRNPDRFREELTTEIKKLIKG